MLAFVLASIAAPVSHLESPTLLLSYCIPAPAVFAALFSPCSALGFCLRSPALLSSHRLLAPVVSYYWISALLLPLPIYDLPLLLESLPLRIFKQSLYDEPWPRISTSLAKPLHLFPTFGSYNLTNNNERKRNFDTTFINSRPLASNHKHEEVNLSFPSYSCLIQSNWTGHDNWIS